MCPSVEEVAQVQRRRCRVLGVGRVNSVDLARQAVAPGVVVAVVVVVNDLPVTLNPLGHFHLGKLSAHRSLLCFFLYSVQLARSPQSIKSITELLHFQSFTWC